MILLSINKNQNISNHVNDIMGKINKYDTERNEYINSNLEGISELVNNLPDDTYIDVKSTINQLIKYIRDGLYYPLLVNITDILEETPSTNDQGEEK